MELLKGICIVLFLSYCIKKIINTYFFHKIKTSFCLLSIDQKKHFLVFENSQELNNRVYTNADYISDYAFNNSERLSNHINSIMLMDNDSLNSRFDLVLAETITANDALFAHRWFLDVRSKIVNLNDNIKRIEA